jgi:hypothetical protein
MSGKKVALAVAQVLLAKLQLDEEQERIVLEVVSKIPDTATAEQVVKIMEDLSAREIAEAQAKIDRL